MITDETLTDIIMICHGWYNRKIYKNELEAMNAYYKKYYHAGDIVFSKDFALHLFLRPLVLQAIEEKPFLARYLFQPVRNDEANKPFSEIMYDRSVALVCNLRKDEWDGSRYEETIKKHQEEDSDEGIGIDRLAWWENLLEWKPEFRQPWKEIRVSFGIMEKWGKYEYSKHIKSEQRSNG